MKKSLTAIFVCVVLILLVILFSAWWKNAHKEIPPGSSSAIEKTTQPEKTIVPVQNVKPGQDKG